ncbi:MAG: SDR family NAD(P)-dependent oxidoreductase [Bdellovibrionota bacterium]|nr:SDR family NAD(P)-dependent oxidoreductase [Bdellovibrionota bacterium]
MISEKIAVITGGASGIGLLIVKRLIRQNYRVIVIDRNREALNHINDEFSQVEIHSCDLGKIEQVSELCVNLNNRLSHIDLFFNNAGIVIGKELRHLTNEEIELSFRVNTISPMILVRDLLPLLERSETGKIINLSSASAFTGVPKLSDYAASKAAFYSFDESLRLELQASKSKVRSLVVCPFYINTGMFDGVKTRFSFLLPILKPEKVVNKIMNSIEKNHSRLIMPWFIYSVFLVKILPTKISDSILSFFGINSSMKDFVGRR